MPKDRKPTKTLAREHIVNARRWSLNAQSFIRSGRLNDAANAMHEATLESAEAVRILRIVSRKK